MNNKKGITLIALIITIIIMLILVVVTINVALNGGIFTKAKEAGEQTQVQADREALLTAAMACIGVDGKIAFTGVDGLDANKPDGFSGSNGIYSKGEYTFTVNANTGEITVTKTGYQEALTEDDDYIKTVFLGEAVNGVRPKNISVIDIYKEDFSGLKDPDIELRSDILLNTSELYVRYDSKNYRVTFDGETGYYTDVIRIGENLPQIVGKYAKFEDDDELWVVLYDEGEKTEGAQLISANGFEDHNVNLGYGGSVIDWSNNDIANETELDGVIGLTNTEKIMYMYFHIATILNNICNEYVGAKAGVTSVRSVGSSPINSNSGNANGFIASSETINDYSGTWFEDNLGLAKKQDQNNNYYYVKKKDENASNPELLKYVIENTDINNNEDYNRLKEMAYLRTDNEIYYFCASGFVIPNLNGYIDTSLNIYIFYGGTFGSLEFLNCIPDHATPAYTVSSGIRPVVTLDSNVLSNASGSGTKDDPYIIK